MSSVPRIMSDVPVLMSSLDNQEERVIE